ncbi:MAG: hypothetical protein ACLR8Y_02370 [Alistipes indistinctus]
MQTLLELCDLIKKKLQRTGHPYHREVVEHLILTLFYEISDLPPGAAAAPKSTQAAGRAVRKVPLSGGDPLPHPA